MLGWGFGRTDVDAGFPSSQARKVDALGGANSDQGIMDRVCSKRRVVALLEQDCFGRCARQDHGAGDETEFCWRTTYSVKPYC